jgi:hypothetical protein
MALPADWVIAKQQWRVLLVVHAPIHIVLLGIVLSVLTPAFLLRELLPPHGRKTIPWMLI